MKGKLTALQRELLTAFFARASRFVLTGGAALAGFHLGHRTTHDLDLFTESGPLDDGLAALGEAATETGAALETLQTSPDFRRLLVRRGDEAVVVDLVVDAVPRVAGEIEERGGIRLDAPTEILVNKLCALLSRAEIRDIVDVLALDRAGYRMEDALPGAARKDAGFSPGQLAWVLSGIEIGSRTRLPGGWSAADVKRGLEDLQARLAKAAFPTG
jgi:hypothetical protein